MSVRGTAIASAGPVKSVGWANPSLGLSGAVPIAIDSTQWAALVQAQTASSLTLANDGSTLTLSSSGQAVGYFADQAVLGSTVVIGAQAAAATVPPANQASAYVMLETGGQIVGFGAIDALTINGKTISFQPVQGRIAGDNASAALLAPLPAGVDAAALWAQHEAVQYPLYAPALVNR